MKGKKIKRLISTLAIACFGMLAMPMQVFASTAVVQKVSTELSNGTVTTATVTSEIQLYYSTSISVVSLTELKSQIENCLVNKNPSVSLKYTGGDVTNYSTAISTSIAEVLANPANDYARYTMKGYSYSYSSLGDITINFTYIETAAQSAFVDTTVKGIVASIITPGMTDEQKEKAVNDYIVSHIAYDTTLVQHSAYAGLVSPYKTVCQGYALLAYKLLTEAGLEARIISGSAGGPHAWNLVKINGNWYHLDTTWNDPLPDVVGRIRYDFFNLQDAQIGDVTRYHTWDKTKYVGYECVTPYVTTDQDILNSGRMNESKAPDVNNITITNNAVIADKIKVTGLKAGDTLKVFSDASLTAKLLGSVVVPAAGTEVNLSVTQIGVDSGKVYFSVLTPGSKESARIAKDFVAEPITAAVDPSRITVTNTIIGDKVNVTGLFEKDVVRVYSAADGTGKLLGTATVALGKTEATVSIAQLGKLSGNVYVTVANYAKRESLKVEKAYDAEPVSIKPDAANITTTNNAGMADTVKVTGLLEKDIVKVYSISNTTKILLGTATVLLGKTEATVNIAKFPLALGNVYVSVTSPMKLESGVTEAAYVEEQVTAAVDPAQITVTNTIAGDKVYVTGLNEKDVVRVYSAADGTGKLLGTATVALGKTEGVVSIAQLGKLSGNVYVTVANYAKRESSKVEKAYDAEPVSIKPDAANITAANNARAADTVKVVGLTTGDIVKVYDKTDSTKRLLGAATVLLGKTEATVSIAQLPVPSGNVYVSVTSPMKLESVLTEKAYIAEQTSTAIDVSQITITNTILLDTIKITGLAQGDMIKVYNKSDLTAIVLGTATVAAGKTEAVVNVTQLGKAGGSVFITVSSNYKLESTRTEKAFAAE